MNLVMMNLVITSKLKKQKHFNSQLQLQSGITRQITLDSPELFVLTHFKWTCLKTLEYYNIV